VSDADLLARSLTDPHAFEELVTSLGPRVHAYLARRDLRHADDLLSEVWLAAFENRHRYDAARGEAAAWVFGIARNVLLAHLRRRQRAGAPGAVAESHVDEWEAVDQRLDAAGHAPTLRRALAELPPEERDVLLLVAWEQLTPSEAAAALGIPAGTARSRLHRARTRIADAWGASTALSATQPGERS
jgi:RNA polymerase sigma-70 factor (ECF subfamily)